MTLLGDGRFWNAFLNTLLIVLLALALQFVAGLLSALGLYRLPPALARLLTVLLFLPNIITPVVGALFLRWMFVSQWGLIDVVLTSLGISPLNWLGHPLMAKLTIVLADSWRQAPFVMLVLYAGLLGLDRDTIEAGG